MQVGNSHNQDFVVQELINYAVGKTLRPITPGVFAKAVPSMRKPFDILDGFANFRQKLNT